MIVLPALYGVVAVPRAGHLGNAAELLASLDGEQEEHLFDTVLAGIPHLHDALGDLLHDGIFALLNGPQNVLRVFGFDVHHASLTFR